jgi:hypothetical protein
MRDSFREFLCSFAYNWMVAASGVVSVPFTIAGAFLEGWGRYVTLALAATCFVAGAFFIWREERRRADALAARLVPKIQAGPVRSIVAFEEPGHIQRRYVQISVTAATNAAVRNCQAHLTHVSKLENGTFKEIFKEDLLCLWSMLDHPTADLLPGVERHLNIASARTGLHTVLAWKPELQATPNALANKLSDPTVYRFHISITGEDVALPCRIGVSVDTTSPENWAKAQAS